MSFLLRVSSLIEGMYSERSTQSAAGQTSPQWYNRFTSGKLQVSSWFFPLSDLIASIYLLLCVRQTYYCENISKKFQIYLKLIFFCWKPCQVEISKHLTFFSNPIRKANSRKVTVYQTPLSLSYCCFYTTTNKSDPIKPSLDLHFRIRDSFYL